MSELNVEKIMEEIREEIRQKGYTYDMLGFDDVVVVDMMVNGVFDKTEFKKELFQLNARWRVNANRPIEKKRGIKGLIVTLYKTIVRKSIRFYVTAITEDQNLFNASLVRSIGMLNLYIEKNSRLESEIKALKREHEKLEKEIKRLAALAKED